MVKKKVVVFGLVLALLVGSGSVYASPSSNDGVLDTSVVVSEAGVPSMIKCEQIAVPKGTIITGEMLLSYLTVVDSDLKDLGMKDLIRFSAGAKGGVMTADEKAKQINDGLSRGETTLSLVNYPMVNGYLKLSFVDVVEGVPVGIIGNPAFEIPANIEITGDLLKNHFKVVDITGKDLDMGDKIRFLTGKGGTMTPDEQANLLKASFKEDVSRKISIIALVEGYSSLSCESTVLLGQIVDKPSISYTTHVQNVGWQKYVSDGAMAGTEGRSLRLEGIIIESGIEGVSVEYATHVQNIGWQGYVEDGKVSGTEGKSYRLEAIKIRLTGENAGNYDVYYRVHAQNVGWMGWASNGAESGTAGFGYRLEGIEIKIVDKGTVVDVGGEAFRDANATKHTVTFHSVYTNAVERPKTVVDGQLVTPLTMSWSGGTFKYWTTDINGMSEFDFSKPIKQDYDLYPVFEDSTGKLVCPRLDSAK